MPRSRRIFREGFEVAFRRNNVPACSLDNFDKEGSKLRLRCLAYLRELRWEHGFVCPNCGHDDGYQLQSRPLIQCPLCRHQTSITSGTLFHKTRIPLRIWFYIIYAMSLDKGGASSTRLATELGMHQTTVWFMQHKIRHAMGRRDEPIQLAGFIEMDEAIIGPHARRTAGPRLLMRNQSKKNLQVKTARSPNSLGEGA